MKKNKGITLIALVITIVILLILAAISINAIVGENGILARAQKSRMDSLIAKEKEQIEIAYNNLKANKIIYGDEITDESLKEELEKNGNNMKSVTEEPDGFLIIFADTENEHMLNPETGEVILSKAGNGYSQSGGNGGTGGSYYGSATSNTAKNDSSFSIVPAVDPKFAVYDGLNGNRLDGYDALFDKDYSTGVTRRDGGILYVKWEGSLKGKQLLVKASFSPNDYLAVRYLDKDGNVINARIYDGTETRYANWNGTESVTFVPDNAVALSIYMYYNYGDTLYEIQLFDEGKYNDKLITNLSANNITSYGAKLTWNQTSDVTKTKIYQDGAYIGETEENYYVIDGGLLSNTEYVYCLEPITSNTTDNVKNSKETIKLKTRSEDVEFYVEGFDGYARRYFNKLFDKDLSTGMARRDSTPLIVKWHGDVTGKQIMVKTSFSPNEYLKICFIDSEGNEIEIYRPNGTKTYYLNYQAGESYTFIPENAAAIKIYMYYNYGDTLYEIQILEDGWNNLEKLISNVEVTDIGTYSLKLKWNQTSDVIKTKIYQDQVLLAETEDTEYYIDSNLISNTEYTYTLEPITASTTDSRKNMKETIKAKTKSEDVEFYVDGYEGYSRKLYKELFDKDLSTGMARRAGDPLIVRWNGNVSNKQLYLKTSFSPNEYLKISYIDDEGNIIKVRRSNGLETEYANWNGLETITEIPNNATGLKIYMYYNYGDTIYEIQVMEDGWFNTVNPITNAKATNVTPYSLKLTWKKSNDVTSTKIYQDGVYLDETAGTEYIIDTNLIANSYHIYTLEPITPNVTNSRKNKKVNVKVTTAKEDVEFYVDGFSGYARRYYKELFDNNLSTGMARRDGSTMIVKWTGNLIGKKIRVKTSFSKNDYLKVYFMDSNGNLLSTTNNAGSSTDYINYQSGENIVNVPEGAESIGIYMYYNYGDTIYDISVVK